RNARLVASLRALPRCVRAHAHEGCTRRDPIAATYAGRWRMARAGSPARGGSRPEWESDTDEFPDDEAPTVERTVLPSSLPASLPSGSFPALPSGSFATRWEEVHADELMIAGESSAPPPLPSPHPSLLQIHLRTPMPVAFDVVPPTLPSIAL